jgi:nicotinamidase/pyrazinamidase
MRALLVVDIQNDFLPGGALGVPHGHEVVPVANRVMSAFELVLATRDWHPADHGSFASRHPGHRAGEVVDLNGLPQVLWPDHCVQGTPGAEFAPGLDIARFKRIFYKGTDREIDSYSSFFDNAHRKSTGLGDYLRERGTRELFIMGLATDYCVKATALDARHLGLQARVILEGIRGVELNPGDCRRALDDMTSAGVMLVSAREIPTGSAA